MFLLNEIVLISYLVFTKGKSYDWRPFNIHAYQLIYIQIDTYCAIRKIRNNTDIIKTNMICDYILLKLNITYIIPINHNRNVIKPLTWHQNKVFNHQYVSELTRRYVNEIKTTYCDRIFIQYLSYLPDLAPC